MKNGNGSRNGKMTLVKKKSTMAAVLDAVVAAVAAC
jgi:hypothetical protein